MCTHDLITSQRRNVEVPLRYRISFIAETCFISIQHLLCTTYILLHHSTCITHGSVFNCLYFAYTLSKSYRKMIESEQCLVPTIYVQFIVFPSRKQQSTCNTSCSWFLLRANDAMSACSFVHFQH